MDLLGGLDAGRDRSRRRRRLTGAPATVRPPARLRVLVVAVAAVLSLAVFEPYAAGATRAMTVTGSGSLRPYLADLGGRGWRSLPSALAGTFVSGTSAALPRAEATAFAGWQRERDGATVVVAVVLATGLGRRELAAKVVDVARDDCAGTSSAGAVSVAPLPAIQGAVVARCGLDASGEAATVAVWARSDLVAVVATVGLSDPAALTVEERENTAVPPGGIAPDDRGSLELLAGLGGAVLAVLLAGIVVVRTRRGRPPVQLTIHS